MNDGRVGQSRYRLLFVVLVVLAMWITAWATGLTARFTPESARRFLAGKGPWGLVAFTVLFSTGQLLLRVPSPVFIAAAVAVYGRNLGLLRAIHPGGRLVMMVWQDGERNEWFVSIREALVAGVSTPTVFRKRQIPFSLADPVVVGRILGVAGFSEIDFTDVHEPVYYGKDVAAALEWVRGFSYTQAALRHLGPVATGLAVERLRKMLAEHQNGSGVWFGSRAWTVTAKRNGQPRK